MVKAKAAVSRAGRKRASRATAAKPFKGKRISAARSAKSSKSKPGKSRQRPIELYYWPTPNGWKISMMLEECALPYVLKPVNIGKGEQFTSSFL